MLWSVHFCFIQLILCLVLHCLQTPHDQVRLQALVSGVKSGKVYIVCKQEQQFPYYPWILSNISPARLASLSSSLGMRLVCVVCVYSTLHCTRPCGIPVRSWSHTVCSTWWHTDPLRRTKSHMNWVWTEFSECVCTVHCSALHGPLQSRWCWSLVVASNCCLTHSAEQCWEDCCVLYLGWGGRYWHSESQWWGRAGTVCLK